MGPLKDITILEFAGIGPGPFCGMLLADLGAEVIKINRPESKGTSGELITDRSKKLITFNLKKLLRSLAELPEDNPSLNKKKHY